MSKIRILELFSGYGSQKLAFENIGINCTSDISEIDKYAIKAYNQLHGDTHNWGDITKIDENKLPYYDLITYSSPCQDFSIAGLQRGGDKESGTRSSLLWECERIIRAVKPKYLLMENVKNIVGKKHKHNFIKWLNVLESLGYQNFWKVLNAKDYGIPQNRDRVFVVSILGGGEFLWPNKIELEKKLKDILEPVVDNKYYLSDKQVYKLFKQREGLNFKPCINGDITVSITTKSGQRNSDNYIIDRKILKMFNPYNNTEIKDIAPTQLTNCGLTTSSSSVIIVYNDLRVRKLTPLECFRLMGLKDEQFYKLKGLSDTQLYKMAGNSIVVNVLEEIFKNLLIGRKEKGQLILI